jgi:hypothetical protein
MFWHLQSLSKLAKIHNHLPVFPRCRLLRKPGLVQNDASELSGPLQGSAAILEAFEIFEPPDSAKTGFKAVQNLPSRPSLLVPACTRHTRDRTL